jgi:phosphoribosylaminoimidazolecarboxamide formyltransferase/IMP cyclohydrolase
MTSKFALLSVTDKSGLNEFANSLIALGFSILSTGGTAKYLSDHHIPYSSVSDYTGQMEILDGRVKTLHPKIHGGILARRDNLTDNKEMLDCGFSNIDVVVVNLYPYKEKRVEFDTNGKLTEDDLIEFIDIGGPTLLRASAKNYKYVYSVIDPSDYKEIVSVLKSGSDTKALSCRKRLASKVFVNTASYDLAIAEFLSREDSTCKSSTESQYTGIVLEKVQPLRYGENPHQKAAWYKPFGVKNKSAFSQLQGKELSFNNINDLYAAVSLTLDLNKVFKDHPTCVVIKHANPCGIAIGKDTLDATNKAISCDPMSAFGGIISVNMTLDKETAEVLTKSFYEVIVAPEISEDAQAILATKKNLRVLNVCLKTLQEGKENYPEIRTLIDTALVQNQDTTLGTKESWNWVNGESFNQEDEKDALLAWTAVKHVKSNAIVLAKNGLVIGIGAGQMNRFDSTELAILRAKRHDHDPQGSIAASDAFFPFGDTVESLHRGGIKAVLQPGGSIKDQEVIDTAKKLDVKMIFTGTRHFKH